MMALRYNSTCSMCDNSSGHQQSVTTTTNVTNLLHRREFEQVRGIVYHFIYLPYRIADCFCYKCY